MTLTVKRDLSQALRHNVQIGRHALVVDGSLAEGGNDDGPSPHDLYDAALASCKALTVAWYARRKAIPLTDVDVTLVRDDSGERQGVYKLAVTLHLGGDLSAAQRDELLAVAAKCPVHKLMTAVTTEITTELG
ncbi:OsmC family protein [Massilia sp. DWR3-1-1]|uniref:OsmC family protein n=1 Tax=Massilia sp. DWR3-1-1 TaxID=2804559 RepID=UPI003CF93EC7